MEFAQELEALLPANIPHRTTLIAKAALHLDRIVEANQHFNLTRITTVREAAIKHVLDSVLPWHLFKSATHVLDAGTGAGFPGVPLALALPDVKFTLSESLGKKARFVEATVAELGLHNVAVSPTRTEEILARKTYPAGSSLILTGRAVAPIVKAVPLFGPPLLRHQGARALFYKGPSLADELAEAAPLLQRHKLRCTVIHTYELPDDLGSRSIVEMASGR